MHTQTPTGRVGPGHGPRRFKGVEGSAAVLKLLRVVCWNRIMEHQPGMTSAVLPDWCVLSLERLRY